MYSLPTEFPCVQIEKVNKKVPDKIFCTLGHLSRRSCK